MWLLAGFVAFAVLLVIALGIAWLTGSNERGNDDHEFTDPEEPRR